MTATFYCGATNTAFGDLSLTFDHQKFLEESTESGTALSTTFAAGSPQIDHFWFFVTRVFVPADTVWATGTHTVECNLTTGATQVTGAVRLHRMSQSTGLSLENSGYSAAQSWRIAGVKTYTFSSLGWTSPGLTDRLGVEVWLVNTGTSARTVTCTVGTTDSEVVTPILVGKVIRPTATAVPLAPVATTNTLALDISPTPVGAGTVASALASLTLALSMAASPASAALAPTAPSLALDLSITADTVAAALGSTAPTLDLALNLAPDALTAALTAAEPTLLSALSLDVDAVAAALGSASPTLDMALSLSPDALQAALAAVDPALTLALSVNPDAAAAILVAGQPTAALALSLSPDAAAAALTATQPSLTLALSLALSPSGVTLSAPAALLDLGVPSGAVGCIEAIIQAVRDRFVALVEVALPVPVLHDNEPPESVPAGSAYVRLVLDVPESRQTTMLTPATFRRSGEAVASIFLPVGTGDAEALSIADTINASFRGITAAGVRYDPPPWCIQRGISARWTGTRWVQGDRWEFEVRIPFLGDCEETAP